MNVRRVTAASMLIGVVIALAGGGPSGARADFRPGAAAVHAGEGRVQGINGRLQKNGTIKGSPKANASINGGQTHGKH
jgi:hypothetical protein